MRESFDQPPPGWIGQSSKCCTQLIHNPMVVDYPSMSRVNFVISDFCSLMSIRLLLLVLFSKSPVLPIVLFQSSISTSIVPPFHRLSGTGKTM
jgi:hypothetical protein